MKIPLDKAKKETNYYDRMYSLASKSDNTSEKIYQNIGSQQLFNNNKFYEIGSSRVKMSDIFQSATAKSELKDIVNEYKNRDKIKQFGLRFDNKLLFHGPSGCGKTLSALALANSLKKKIYLINLATIVNSSLGKTSNNLFEIVEDAKANEAIIFFDEFDALSKVRSDENDHGEIKRIASAILQILDFIDEDTIFIGATNYLDLIDSAITRRFSRKIKFEMPSKTSLQSYLLNLSEVANIKINKKIIAKITSHLTDISYAEARDKYLSLIKKYIIKNIKNGENGIKINEDILKLLK